MNSWEDFERMAARAREEQSPGVDVAAPVLQRIRSRPPQGASMPERLLMTFAAGSAAVAALVTLAAYPAWEAWQDPLVNVLTTTIMEIQ